MDEEKRQEWDRRWLSSGFGGWKQEGRRIGGWKHRKWWTRGIEEFDFWGDELYFGVWGAGGVGTRMGDGEGWDGRGGWEVGWDERDKGASGNDGGDSKRGVGYGRDGKMLVEKKVKIGDGGWKEMAYLMFWWWRWWTVWATKIARAVWEAVIGVWG